jgi:type VI secretion system protein ImpK
MSDQGRFGSGGSGHTVVRPKPGGRRRDAGQPRRAAPEPERAPGAMFARSDGGDRNPLTSAAGPLLALASGLRNTASHPDSAQLFKHLADEIKTFEAALGQAGVPLDTVQAASYSLCTLIDEVVLYTPWGGQSVWTSQTLLNFFHREGWGGEKFFQIVDHVMKQPGGNLDLLELLYLCMALGLEGKYRVLSGGRAQLEVLQSDVAQAIRRYRGGFEPELSPHWRGIQDLRPKLARYVPLWVACAVGLGLAVAMYFGFLIGLNQRSDPVAQQVATLGAKLPQLVERQGYTQPPRPVSLQGLLNNQASAGLLEVTQTADTETVVLREGLFPSGSGEVSAERRELLAAVGQALSRVPGAILITGHTDNQPIGRSLRFPSNWHLSKRRAEAVREILAEWVDPRRLTAEARGETEPLVPNDTPEHRALNRRVEITLFALPTRE